VNGRIVGTITATVALIVLGFVGLDLFTALPGLLIAGIIAVIAGIMAGALVEPGRAGRNAAVVGAYIAVLILAHMLLGQTAADMPYQERGAARA
jgi:hypothetical protein